MRIERAPAWPLPLACALVAALAVHAAWAMSRAAGLIPDCNPYLDGCTSISRAARHGAGNALFKALMIPCALLQALNWWIAARWAGATRAAGRAARALRPLAVVAGASLALYAALLGSDGAIYGWMRRYGITFYFGASFLAMVGVAAELGAVARERALRRAMVAILLTMLAVGLASTLAPLAAGEGPALDRARNVLEWHLALLFAAWFCLQALLWKRLGIAMFNTGPQDA